MTWVAAAVGGASLISGFMNAGAAKDAASQQAQAAAAAQAQQQANFNLINQQQAPYREAGYSALKDISAMQPYLTHQFDKTDLQAGLAPNYDWQLQQGQQAANAAANFGGGLIGGNALQGLQNTTQNIAGGAYQNAFNNYQTQRSNIYNTLAGIAGIGQTGQTATNLAGTNATNAIGQLGVGAAGAQASGTLGQAQAYGNAATGAGQGVFLANYLKSKNPAVTPVDGQPDNIVT